MTRTETVKRYSVMIFGLFVTALGVAFCVRANLGISPITTFAYTLSHIFPPLTTGNFIFLQNLVFFLLTVIFMGKDFRPYQALQIPCSFLYGAFVDLWEIWLKFITPNGYVTSFILLLMGVLCMGLGFSLIFSSGVALEANTAFLNAVVLRTGKAYDRLKAANDIIIVAMAAGLSLLCLHKVIGVREGTVIAAVCIGPVAGFFNRRITNGLERFFSTEKVVA